MQAVVSGAFSGMVSAIKPQTVIPISKCWQCGLVARAKDWLTAGIYYKGVFFCNISSCSLKHCEEWLRTSFTDALLLDTIAGNGADSSSLASSSRECKVCNRSTTKGQPPMVSVCLEGRPTYLLMGHADWVYFCSLECLEKNSWSLETETCKVS